MFYTYSNKNEFGKWTHEAKIDTLFRLLIKQMDNDDYLCSLIEKKIFRDKVLFSFTSDAPLSYAVEVGLDKAKDYLEKNTDFEINSEGWFKMMQQMTTLARDEMFRLNLPL
jgi:hypothetical protein